MNERDLNNLLIKMPFGFTAEDKFRADEVKEKIRQGFRELRKKVIPEPKETAEKIVDKIILDFTDRGGLRQAWEDVDEGIQKEIRQAWHYIVLELLGGSW